MKNRLLDLEQQLARAKQQTQPSVSQSHALDDAPVHNRLLQIEQSLAQVKAFNTNQTSISQSLLAVQLGQFMVTADQGNGFLATLRSGTYPSDSAFQNECPTGATVKPVTGQTHAWEIYDAQQKYLGKVTYDPTHLMFDVTLSSRPQGGLKREEAQMEQSPAPKDGPTNFLAAAPFGSHNERRDNMALNPGGWQGINQGLVQAAPTGQHFLGVGIKRNYFIDNTNPPQRCNVAVDLITLQTATQNLRGRRYFAVDAGTGAAIAPNGTTVIFLSGSGGSSEQYGRLLAEGYLTSGRVRQFIAINYRGFGGSTHRTGNGEPSIEGLYQDAQDILTCTLRDHAPGNQGNRFNLIVHGYSLGGPVAARLVSHCLETGTRVKGLVLDRAMLRIEHGAVAHHGNVVGKLGGKLAELVSGDSMSVYDNIKKMAMAYKVQKVPIFVLIGLLDSFMDGDRELFNKLQTDGFTATKIEVQNADHSNHAEIIRVAKLDGTFQAIL